MTQTWRSAAYSIINERFIEIRKEHPDMEVAAILKQISRNDYPWYERENYPYRAWLLAIKDFRKAYSVSTPREEQRELPLFGEI